MMEGKAGVSMESKKKMSRAKSNSPMKRTVRRAVAWLLVFCMCMANMNSAVYAAEIATSSDALMAATPSDATATDSNAAEILMPEETVSGEELKEEAIRAISAGHEFDFDSEIRVVKDAEGKNESYSELFKGYRSFTLFADNGNGGRLTGGSDKAYGYIIVRVEKEAYEAFEKEEGTVKATDSDATDSDAAERSYVLTGNEELVFLYVNADDGTVTFTLNIENLNADDIVVPSHTELYAETEEETEEAGPAEQPAEDANEAGSPGAGGGSGSGSGDSSSDSEDDPTDEGASDDSQTEGGQTEGGNSGSADTDTEAPAEKPEDGQTEGGSDSQQENNGSSDTDTENGNTDSGDDGNTGNSEDNGSNSGSGNDNHGNADSGNTGNTENSGNSGSGSGSEGGKDEGGSSDKGDSSDKDDSHQGGSDSGSGSSNSGNSGNSGSGNSSDKGSSSDKGGSDSDSAKLSKSSLNLPMVMGPNPNAEFEEDEFGDMSFDEWQEMMEEEEEEAEEEEDYTDEVSVAYDSEDDGISYLNMTMLPAVGATVKKAQPKRAFKLFKSSRSDEAEAVVMAGVVPLSGLSGADGGYYKQIEANGDGTYKLHLGLTGGGNQGLDIVLVIDNSGSMDKNGRIESLQKTLGYIKEGRWSEEENGFIDQVLGNGTSEISNPNNRIAIATYQKTGKDVLNGWSKDKTTVKKAIGNLQPKGGTNYEAGLVTAKTLLENRGDSKNIPVVIFLSDGMPTYYYKDAGEFGYGTVGASGTETTETVGDETIFVAGEFHKYMEEIQGVTYGVGFGITNLESDYKVYTPAQYLYAIAEGITGQREDVTVKVGSGLLWYDKVYENKLVAPTSSENVIMANNGTAEELEDAFASIQKNLEMVNVQVHDKLSRFVTFVGDTPETSNVQVVRKTVNSQGEVVHKETLHQGTDYKSVVLDRNNGTIDLVFGNTEKALENYVYELSFDIKLKEDVNITAEDKSVGDQNTDFDPENNISSGKSGVRTNEEAYFTFGKDGKTTVKYPHPVIPASATYKPEHQKYIKDNGDGTYDLTLNVTSTKASSEETHTESVPADVLFLMDKSRSMVHRLDSKTEGKYEGSRAEAVNNALTIAIDTLGSYKDIQLGGYKWSNEPSGFFGWYGEAEQAKENLRLYWGTDEWDKFWKKWKYAQGGDVEQGGTYPASALTAAVSKLKEDNRENVKKYIIFLTDGEPSEWSEYRGSYTAVENLQNLMPGTKLYAVGVTKDTNNTFMEKVVRTANGLGEDDSTDGLYINGSNEAEVNAALKQIADEIVNEVTNSIPGVTNVTITDTLSKYAEFAFDTSNLGNVRVTRKTADGTETELQKDEYRVDISEKTIAVSLMNVNDEEGKKNELEKDVTYSITFQVKPSQAAKDAYQQDGGYHRNPDGSKTENVFTGAEGTDAPDAPGNTTSSGQPGFPSNEKAVLSWQYDGAAGKTEYDHPVLQVPQTGQFVVQKLVEIDDNETPLADAKFIINLEKTDVAGSQGQKFSSVALKNKETSPVVKTEGEAHFKISEAVPMEYSLKGIKVFQKTADAGQQDITAERLANSILTVKPGDDLIVQLTNNLAHEGYFHSVDQVTNRTTGNPEDPFTNDKSAAREAAESQPTADTGKRNKKVAEMEEEEGDPLV